jgi:hypothetical protein
MLFSNPAFAISLKKFIYIYLDIIIIKISKL